MSETFLDTSLDRKDNWLKIEGYNLIRSDDPMGSKEGDICIYYREHIPLIRRGNLCSLYNCLETEICLENGKCVLPCLYQSPSQNKHEFEHFCTLRYSYGSYKQWTFPTCSVLIGDFNAKLSKWYNNDITNANGCAPDDPTLSAGY